MEESHIQKFVPRALNSTFLTLIPKGKSADSPDKFRPIALYNGIYKIISKVPANQLKYILPLLISHHQSGYVEGRQIMDSIILSHELIHSLKIQKNPTMMIQLDMSKAFDKISWDYMRQVLAMFGFLKDGIKWIMQCVRSILLHPCEWLPFDTLPSFQRYQAKVSYLSLPLCHHGRRVKPLNHC